MEALRALPPPSAGGWLKERLHAFGSTVAGNVPSGFAAYARVLHPVDLHEPASDASHDPATDPGEGAMVTWSQVCERTGRTPHALMQWRSITAAPVGSGLSLSSDGLWDEVIVQEGTLQPAVLARLLDVLTPSTGEQECFHALWEGYGWLHGSSTLVVFTHADGAPAVPPERAGVPRELQQALAAPRLSLPGRNYLLFAGPLRAALSMGHQVTDDWFLPQSPNLLWPADRSWCVASEIDFDSTLIGGSAELIEAVLAAPGLEAWAVGEDDDLGLFADTVNT